MSLVKTAQPAVVRWSISTQVGSADYRALPIQYSGMFRSVRLPEAARDQRGSGSLRMTWGAGASFACGAPSSP